MTVPDLLTALNERGDADAASSDQIRAVRLALALADDQSPGSQVYVLRIKEAARLVADSWPFDSELGALVLTLSQAATSNSAP